MTRERAPRPAVTWEAYMAAHNETVIPDDAPDPPSTRAQRRAARKRKTCALCHTDLYDTGRPMTRGRWRCDAGTPCAARHGD